jgi:hypothetical protein
MHLYRIGGTVLNLDRINGILDHHGSGDPQGAHDGASLSILFDQGQIDLSGHEAEVFRRWYRHACMNLDPLRDEHGEELIRPEAQVRKALNALNDLIDRTRPRDAVMRRAAHRLWNLVDRYLTGELEPIRAIDFERTLEEPRPEA